MALRRCEGCDASYNLYQRASSGHARCGDDEDAFLAIAIAIAILTLDPRHVPLHGDDNIDDGDGVWEVVAVYLDAGRYTGQAGVSAVCGW